MDRPVDFAESAVSLARLRTVVSSPLTSEPRDVEDAGAVVSSLSQWRDQGPFSPEMATGGTPLTAARGPASASTGGSREAILGLVDRACSILEADHVAPIDASLMAGAASLLQHLADQLLRRLDEASGGNRQEEAKPKPTASRPTRRSKPNPSA